MTDYIATIQTKNITASRVAKHHTMRGFAHFLVLVVIAIMLIGGLGWYFVYNQIFQIKETTSIIDKTEINCSDFGNETCPTHKGCDVDCTLGSCLCTGDYVMYKDIELCLLDTYEKQSISDLKISDKELAIHLQETFVPTENISFASECFNDYSDHIFYGYIQLSEPNTRQTRELLDSYNIDTLQALNSNAYHVMFPANTNITQDLAEIIRWIGVVEPRHKMQKSLWEGNVGNWALAPNGNVKLNIRFFTNVEEGEAIDILDRNNAEIVDMNNYDLLTYNVVSPMESIKLLATENAIFFIDTISPPPQLETLNSH